jgi:outer membrane protein assembly factor BamA
VPVLGYSQEAGLQLGVAGIFSFYTDIKTPNNKASTIFTNLIYSTKGQNRISFKSDIWTKRNAYHILGDVRIAHSLFDFYGLGNQTKLANADRILQKQVRFGIEVEKEFLEKFYLGAGTEFDSQNFEDIEPGGIFNKNAPNDRSGGKAIFFKLTQLYDTRNNSIYPDKGFFIRTRLSVAPDLFGGDNFKGNHIDVDFRAFKKITSQLILGFNVNFEKLNYAKNVESFYFQPQLGGDQIMRGYYIGRFRAPNLIATQAELRYRIIPRLGLVGFAGTGMVYNNNQFAVQNLKPNYGLGTRLFFDLEKALSLRLDYGFGEKPAGEKRISGFYISLGEAF